MSEESVIEKIVLAEITGKNMAIHAYDKMIWTVRTGFLSLFFAAWGILFKAIVDSPSKDCSNMHGVLLGMVLVSIALAVGAYVVDINYVRRKFRVIYALDGLLAAMMDSGEKAFADPAAVKEYVAVSGDKDDNNYQQVSGYPTALKAGIVIYLVAMIIAGVCAKLLW